MFSLIFCILFVALVGAILLETGNDEFNSITRTLVDMFTSWRSAERTGSNAEQLRIE